MATRYYDHHDQGRKRRKSEYLECISLAAMTTLVEAIRQTVLISFVYMYSKLGVSALV